MAEKDPQATTSGFEQGIRNMLERAALFRTLGAAFAYPDFASWHAVSEGLARGAEVVEPSSQLGAALCAAVQAWRAVPPPEQGKVYARFFATDARCPLHETAYGDGQRLAGKSAELADLQGFYQAFAVNVRDERADHLAVELEFYSLLLIKEAWARSENWQEQAAVTRSAARQFLRDHLARWLAALAGEMEKQTVPSPYPDLLAAVVAAVAEEQKRLHVAVQPLSGRAGPDSMQADRFDCPHEASAEGRGRNF